MPVILAFRRLRQEYCLDYTEGVLSQTNSLSKPKKEKRKIKGVENIRP